MKRLPGAKPLESGPRHLAIGNESIYIFQEGGASSPKASAADAPLRQYARIIWKYRVICAACTLGAFVISLLYAFTVTPLYTATSKIKIGTYEPILTATKIEDVLEQKSKESNYLETQIQEIESLSLADKVLGEDDIRKAVIDDRPAGWFSWWSSGESERRDGGASYKSSIKEMQRYLDGIGVEPIKRTSLVRIAATFERPETAALVANRHASAYIDWVREKRMEQQSRGLIFLRKQAEELREKVVDIERDLAEYAEANSIVAVNKDENIVVQKMSQLNKLLTDTTSRRIETGKLYDSALAALEQDSAGFDDGSILSMRAELAKLEAQYTQLEEKYTESYPKMVQLQSRIKQLTRTIKAQRKQIVNGLKAKAQAAVEEERQLKDELDRQTSQAFELSKRQVQYNVLNRELSTSRDLLQNVLKQIKETSLAVESNSSSVAIVDQAIVPEYPSFPRKKLIVLGSLVGGLLAGVLLALFLNHLDNTIRTPDDLGSFVSLPALGVVPSFDLNRSVLWPGGPSPASYSATKHLLKPSSPFGSQRLIFINSPASLASEAYRTIRTGLMLSRAGEPPRTMLVSSAQSGEGKTTSTVNLAASLASTGGRVLLIEGDLRRPTMHKHFDLEPSLPGLTEVLTRQRQLEETLISSKVKNLTLLLSGAIPPNPAELLGSKEMALLIDELALVFDYVLIDSPPILPVTDSLILSRKVDGVILVVKGAATPGRAVREAVSRLEGVGASFLGIILNDVDVTSGDYQYYGKYYQSYQQSAA